VRLPTKKICRCPQAFSAPPQLQPSGVSQRGWGIPSIVYVVPRVEASKLRPPSAPPKRALALRDGRNYRRFRLASGCPVQAVDNNARNQSSASPRPLGFLSIIEAKINRFFRVRDRQARPHATPKPRQNRLCELNHSRESTRSTRACLRDSYVSGASAPSCRQFLRRVARQKSAPVQSLPNDVSSSSQPSATVIPVLIGTLALTHERIGLRQFSYRHRRPAQSQPIRRPHARAKRISPRPFAGIVYWRDIGRKWGRGLRDNVEESSPSTRTAGSYNLLTSGSFACPYIARTIRNPSV